MQPPWQTLDGISISKPSLWLFKSASCPPVWAHSFVAIFCPEINFPFDVLANEPSS